MSLVSLVWHACLQSIGTVVAWWAHVTFTQQPRAAGTWNSVLTGLTQKPTRPVLAQPGFLPKFLSTKPGGGRGAVWLFHHRRYNLTLQNYCANLRGYRIWGPTWAQSWGYALTPSSDRRISSIATRGEFGIWGLRGFNRRPDVRLTFYRMFSGFLRGGSAYQFYVELSMSCGAMLPRLNTRQTSVLRLTVSNEQNRLRGIVTSYTREHVVTGATRSANDLTLTEVPASSLAAMFGYARRYQKTPFIRLGLFKHLRRYLLILEQLRVDLALRGAMRHFRLYFKALNQPLAQVLQNPISGAFIPDFALEVKGKEGLQVVVEGLESRVCAMLTDSLSSAPQTSIGAESGQLEEGILNSLTLSLTSFFTAELEKTPANHLFKGVLLHRYRLCWEQVFFQKIVEHCLRKKKKARSIKKRRTKRLVSKTKYRFWAL